MALNFQLPGYNYTGKIVGYIPRISSGLVSFHLLGTDIATDAKNYASGGLSGVIVGNPVQNTGYLRTTGQTAYLQLGTNAPSTDQSWMIVFRNVADVNNGATTLPLMGDGIISGTATSGFVLKGAFSSAGPPVVTLIQAFPVVNNSGTPTSGSAASTAFTLGVWTACIVRFREGAGYDIQNLTSATAVVSKTETRSTIRSGLPLRVGSVVGATNGTAQSDIAFTAVWNRSISDVEAQTQYTQIKNYLNNLYSITV